MGGLIVALIYTIIALMGLLLLDSSFQKLRLGLTHEKDITIYHGAV